MKRMQREINRLQEHRTKKDTVELLGRGQFELIERGTTRTTRSKKTCKWEYDQIKSVRSAKIRIGEIYQANIPTQTNDSKDRGDVLIKQEYPF